MVVQTGGTNVAVSQIAGTILTSIQVLAGTAELLRTVPVRVVA